MKKLILGILCGILFSVNFVIADSLNLENSNFAVSKFSQTNLDDKTIKELEKYDRNVRNTPKTEQEKAELERLVEAILNVDYDKTKEILDNSPSLINLNAKPFTTPISAWFYSFINYKVKRVEFDEKMFNLLMSYKPELYANDLLPFMITMNKNIEDNRTLELLQIMQKEGLNLNLEFPKILNTEKLPIYLITEALATKKFNTMEFLIKNDAKSPVYNGLGVTIGFQIAYFFEENGLKIDTKTTVSEKQKELANSQKYMNFKDKQFEFLNLYLNNGGDISTLILAEIGFKYLGDTDGLERLKKLGYKERCDNNGKNCNSKK
ncbi:MAG: hypothetical protein J6M14_03975 [Campylobacter sp.]|nr:hypothetical protein [Campylobacter sp.]